MQAAMGCSRRNVISRSARHSDTSRCADARETWSILAISSWVWPAMKYSQPARAASSSLDFSFSAAMAASSVLPEIGHARKDPIRSGAAQYSLAVTRGVMAAADKSPDSHAGGLGRLHAADAVLDDQCARGRDLHLLGRMEKQIRRRLAVLHHLRGVKPVAEVRRKPGDIERKRHPVDIARRCHAERRVELGQNRSHP